MLPDPPPIVEPCGRDFFFAFLIRGNIDMSGKSDHAGSISEN